MATAPLPVPELESSHAHPKQPAAFPPADTHGWSAPPANAFFVRGPRYLDNKEKVPAGEPFLQPIALDLLKSSSKITHIMNHPQCCVRAALSAAKKAAPKESSVKVEDVGTAQEPFIWVFNLQLPSKENHSVVMYYVSSEKPEEGSLIQRFLDGSDAFRNERIKFLTNIPQGPRLVKLVVGEKGAVCMLGKVFKCTYIKGKDYIEVDVDVGSSLISSAAYHLCIKLTGFATIDFGFVLEGRHSSELPERVLGGIRLEKLDLSHASWLYNHTDVEKLTDESEEKCKHTASYQRLWKSLYKGGQAGHGGATANGA